MTSGINTLKTALRLAGRFPHTPGNGGSNPPPREGGWFGSEGAAQRHQPTAVRPRPKVRWIRALGGSSLTAGGLLQNVPAGWARSSTRRPPNRGVDTRMILPSLLTALEAGISVLLSPAGPAVLFKSEPTSALSGGVPPGSPRLG